MEEAYLEAFSKIKKRMRDMTISDISSASSLVNGVPHGGIIRVETERLPDVGTFSGDPADWPTFAPMRKLQLLQKACIGSAAKTLGPWSARAESYLLAWKHMYKVYEDPFRVQQEVLNKLIDHPPLEEESSSGLLAWFNVAEANTRQLQTTNVPVQHWDAILINIMSRKLPRRTLKSWDQSRSVGCVPTWSQLKEFVLTRGKAHAYVDVEEAKTSSVVVNSERKREYQIDQQQNKSHHNAHNQKRDQPQKPWNGAKSLEYRAFSSRPNCRYCEGDHPMFRCRDFLKLALTQRREATRQMGLCQNCFRAGHKDDSCWKPGCVTSQCKGVKHNSVLCEFQIEAKPKIASAVHIIAGKRARSPKPRNHSE